MLFFFFFFPAISLDVLIYGCLNHSNNLEYELIEADQSWASLLFFFLTIFYLSFLVLVSDFFINFFCLFVYIYIYIFQLGDIATV